MDFAFWTVNLVLISAGLFFLLRKYLTRNFGYWESKNISTLKPQPFFGNVGDVFKGKSTMAEVLKDIYDQTNAPVLGIYIIDKPALLLKDLDIIKSVLIKDFNFFSDRTVSVSDKVDPLAAHMLFLSKGEEWKNTRAKMSPAFTSGKLKNMTYLINQVGDNLMEHLEQNWQKPEHCAKKLGEKFFTDVISSCAFGINANSLKDENSEFKKHGSSLFAFNFRNAVNQATFFFAPKIAYLIGATFATKETKTFFENVFKTIIEERKQSGATRNDLIDIIVKILKDNETGNGFKFGEDLLLSQAFQFFAAGFETSSTTMSFLLYELCQNQDIQDKLRKEILDTLEEHKEFSYDAIQSMKYLDQCVNEIVRMYPVLPFLDRLCMEDYKIPKLNITLEKGTWVYIPMYALHMDPQHYPEPEKFKPERFSPENVHNIPQMAHIGFGSGPRNCIGERFAKLSVKMCLAHMLSKYSVNPSKNTQSKIEFEKKTLAIQAKGGLPMKFTKISY